MCWYKLADNPMAVTELYSQVPPLQNAHLIQFFLHENGPQASMMIELNQRPDKLPKRWKLRNYQRFLLQIDFWGVDDLSFRYQRSQDAQVDITIKETEDHRKSIHVRGGKGDFHYRADVFRLTLHKEA